MAASLLTSGQDNPDLQELGNPSSELDLSLVPGLTSALLCPAAPPPLPHHCPYQFLLGTLASKLLVQTIFVSVCEGEIYGLYSFGFYGSVQTIHVEKIKQTQDFVLMGP